MKPDLTALLFAMERSLSGRFNLFLSAACKSKDNSIKAFAVLLTLIQSASHKAAFVVMGRFASNLTSLRLAAVDTWFVIFSSSVPKLVRFCKTIPCAILCQVG
jgi:hypothetical protein